ncbi:transcriptional regulator, XRE family [hydrothermal vent metagenome]|uniref:Transcriptional regulator, XRE family n=1 Tax=hydrothermal vent metagenome TaxID=652676 RepID=A0A3B0W4G6_9ZZZZ
MKKNNQYSQYSINAVSLIGRQIRVERKYKKMTTIELAERAGISRGLLQRIEKGDPKCNIGAVFEVATIVGIKLFDADKISLQKQIYQLEEKLILLPKSIRHKRSELKDDF